MDRAADQLADRIQENKSVEQARMERLIGGEVRTYQAQTVSCTWIPEGRVTVADSQALCLFAAGFGV